MEKKTKTTVAQRGHYVQEMEDEKTAVAWGVDGLPLYPNKGRRPNNHPHVRWPMTQGDVG